MERSYYRREKRMVLYGIILLAKQFLGTFLDIEVDQSEVRCLELCLYGIKELTTQISTTDP